MTENSIPLNKPFNVEDWMQDANLPRASAEVFKAGDLPAEASTLQRQIETERGMERIDRSSADVSRFAELERRYIQVVGDWLKSKITVYVSAIPPEEIRAMRVAHDEKTKDFQDKATANELFGYELLAASVIGVAEHGVNYTDEDGEPALFGPVTWTIGQVRGLAKKIGGAQMGEIIRARQTAQGALPTVDADFLLKNSGEDTENTAA